MNLLGNIRFYILSFSFLLSVGIFLVIKSTIPAGELQTIKLTQDYAFVSLTYLYLALLATPVTKLFLAFPWRAQYIKSRRGIGVSTFYFALLHTLFAFFGQLGGFGGLGFLSDKYLWSIILGFGGLLVLSLLASTSFDFVVDKLTFPKWKLLHRLVYVGGILILVHTVMLGTHYLDLSKSVPQITFWALGILLILESFRLDRYLNFKFKSLPKFGLAFILVGVGFLIGGFYLYSPFGNVGTPSLGIHAAHIQLAEQVVSQTSQPNNFSNIPGLDGDRTARFTISMNVPDDILPNQDTTLKFRVYNASNGAAEAFFKTPNEKPMHLVIVNNDLTYFTHIHPVQQNYDFVITTQFPSEGTYRLYVNTQPLGGIEQQMAFTVNVGNPSPPRGVQTPDYGLSKTVGQYRVTLVSGDQYRADSLTFGKQLISFKVTDAKSGQDITNLKPYLNAFGHLVMINTQTFDYLHVHPANLTAPPPNASGGPEVDFLPIGIYGPVKPGIYHLFVQFNPDGNLFTADFTVQVN